MGRGFTSRSLSRREKKILLKKVRNERPIPPHCSFGKARSPRAFPGVRLPAPGRHWLVRPRPNSGFGESTAASQACRLTLFYYIKRGLKLQTWPEAKTESTHTVAAAVLSLQAPGKNRATHLLIGGK
jgi:hypothetical protein